MSDDITNAIIEDIRRVAHRLGTKSLARTEYYLHGKYSQYQMYESGNNWTDLCGRAGIVSKTKQTVSDEEHFCNLAKAEETLGRYPRVSERKKFGLNASKRRFPTLAALILESAPSARLFRGGDFGRACGEL
jgi:hypothetical protein